MKLNNVSQIIAEDYDDDDQELISKLGGTLNSFMQEVSELADKRIDFENRVENILTLELTIGANGIPRETTKINANKGNIRGFSVISVFNLTNPKVYPDSQPFLAYTPIGGTFIEVNKITGLPSGYKYRLTIIAY